MRRAVCAIVALGLASGVRAEDFKLHPDAERQLRVMGQLAYTASACETWLPPANSQDVQDLINGKLITFRSADERYRPSVVKMLRDVYRQGTTSPTREQMTAELCQRLLNEDIAALRRGDPPPR